MNDTRGLNIYIRVNDLGLKNFFTVIWNLRTFYSLQIEHYALNITFCVQCYSVLYFSTAYYSAYGVNSFTSMNGNEYLYLKVAGLVIYMPEQ